MLGKLNDKYHNIFFTNTVFNAAVLCTSSVLQFFLLPKMKQERKAVWDTEGIALNHKLSITHITIY
jgi:hypothetical protein